jgi:hypothetical protein
VGAVAQRGPGAYAQSDGGPCLVQCNVCHGDCLRWLVNVRFICKQVDRNIGADCSG